MFLIKQAIIQTNLQLYINKAFNLKNNKIL